MGNREVVRSWAGEGYRAWPREEIRNRVRFSTLLALGILLNTLESLILPRGWPIRLGLANLSLMCGLFLLRPRDLFLLAAFRVIVSSLIFGYFFQLPMWLGLAGGMAATTVMEAAYAVHRGVFSWVGISLLGAAAHASAQLGLFAWWFAPSVWGLFPWFLALSLLGGLLMGLLMMGIERRLTGDR